CEYYLDFAAWGYMMEEQCADFRLYTYFYRYAVMLLLVAVLDIASVLKVRYIQSSRVSTTSARNNSLERRLLYQACAQASLFLADLVSAFVILSHFESHQWPQFFLSTIVWVAAMGADGIMIFVFNKEIRNVIFNAIKCKISSVSSSTNMSRLS
ncbi:hypothetical protein PMAYCL1PPCAC_17094, partial [Pristionchus mayeri]